MGGGGGGGSTKFKAQGNPPSYDYQSALGLEQLAVGGDVAGYTLSDQDFANRYPALQDAYNQWQGQLGNQVGQVAQGAAGQQQLMQGLGGQILGRQGTDTTSDINNVRAAAQAAAGAVSPIYGNAGAQSSLAAPIVGLGQQQASLAQPLSQLGMAQAGLAGGIAGLGQQQAGLAGGLQRLGQGVNRQMNMYGQQQANLGQQQAGLAGQQVGIGQGLNQMGGQLAQNANIPLQTGQQLLNEPIDPQVQQQMMKAGLGSAAGALGAASLGQGMAGQAAAARQLGLNTMQYGQQMRGEAMQDINQYSSMLGQAGQLQGLGAQTIGAGAGTLGAGAQTIGGGANTIGQGGQIAGQLTGLAGQQLASGAQSTGLAGQQLAQGGSTIGLGGQQLAQGGQTMGLGGSQLAQGSQQYGQGAQAAATAGGLAGQAQGAQEQYQMDTANMANIYGSLQNQQASNLLGNIANAGQMFQKRPFGLGGASLAQTELGQANAYNSFNQSNYATMNGIAWNQAQQGMQQQQMQNANTAGMVSTGVGIATSAATIAALHCWVARACYGTGDNRWKIFRHWLMNQAPSFIRRVYLKHGQAFSVHVRRHALLRSVVRFLMDRVVERTSYVNLALA